MGKNKKKKFKKNINSNKAVQESNVTANGVDETSGFAANQSTGETSGFASAYGAEETSGFASANGVDETSGFAANQGAGENSSFDSAEGTDFETKPSGQVDKDIAAYKDKARKRKEQRQKEMRKKYRLTLEIAAGVLLLVAIIFGAIKWYNRPYSVNYSSLDIEGEWYATNIDDVGSIKVKDDKFEYKDSTGKVVLNGEYDISKEKIEIGGKEYKFLYFDENEDFKKSIDNKSDFAVNKYFLLYLDGNEIYCSDSLEDAEDQADSNMDLNAYYKKSDMFDANGFAVDEEDRLLAYAGNASQVTIPSNVKFIGENAMSADYDRALNVKEITVPNTVIAIEPFAFSFSKIEKLNIADGVNSIKIDAFSDCEIKEIHFPDSINSLDNNIFGESPQLKGTKLFVKKDSNVDNYLKNANLRGNYEIVYR